MSRSGTSMLNVLMDSHPDIAMCYDVVPQPFDKPLTELAEAVDDLCRRLEIQSVADVKDRDKYRTCCKFLKEVGGNALERQFVVTRRSMLSPDIISEVFRQLSSEGVEFLTDNVTRMYAGAKFVEVRRAQAAKEYSGLKAILPPSVVHECFPNAFWLFIFRDPRDVYASHKRLAWDASLEDICNRWNSRVERLHTMQDDANTQVHALRMEDLLFATHESLQEILTFLGLPYFDCADNFAESAGVFGMEDAFNGKIHAFWDTGLDRSKSGAWCEILDEDEAERIEKLCNPGMIELRYL